VKNSGTTQTDVHLCISRRLCDNSSPGHTADIIIGPDGIGKLRVLGASVSQVQVFEKTNLSFNRVLLDSLLEKLHFKYRRCEGMSFKSYEKEFKKWIRYEPKHLRRQYVPEDEMHSDECQQWYNSFGSKSKSSVCKKCVVFFRNLRFTSRKEINIGAKQAEQS
jgi:hypothetical protein